MAQAKTTAPQCTNFPLQYQMLCTPLKEELLLPYAGPVALVPCSQQESCWYGSTAPKMMLRLLQEHCRMLHRVGTASRSHMIRQVHLLSNAVVPLSSPGSDAGLHSPALSKCCKHALVGFCWPAHRILLLNQFRLHPLLPLTGTVHAAMHLLLLPICQQLAGSWVLPCCAPGCFTCGHFTFMHLRACRTTAQYMLSYAPRMAI